MAKKIDLESQLSQIAKYENEINSNKSYKISKRSKVPKTKFVDHDVTQCNNCFFSCHERCKVGEDKIRCWAISNGFCTQCKGKCPVSAHVNSTQIITMVDKVEKIRDKDMRKRYYDASSKKSVYQQIKEGLMKEIKTTEVAQLQVHLQIKECFEELDKIALVTNV